MFCKIRECQSPLHKRKASMEDLLAMVLLVTNKGKHYARVVGRSPTQQLDQVRKSRWRLYAGVSQL